MSSNIVDNSSFGTSNIKNLYTSIIRASKATSTDTFADLKLQAYNTSQTKNVTMTLSVQSDTPKLTLSSQGVATAGTIISGIANPQSSGDIITKGSVDTHASSTSTHGVTGNIVGTGGVQTLDNKTLTNAVITAASNNIAATSLRSSNGSVSINTGGAPVLKNALVASSSTVSKWETIPYVPIEIFNVDIDNGNEVGISPGIDLYTRIRHGIFIPPGNLTYLIKNSVPTILPNRDLYVTVINTGTFKFQADTNVHLYCPGYNGTPGGSYTYGGVADRGKTIWLKKRNDTEWLLMMLH